MADVRAGYGCLSEGIRRASDPGGGAFVTIGILVRDAGSPVLLERDVELERLRLFVAEARAGRGGVVSIEGPAGIGKTAVLASAQRFADEQGFRVLRARGWELEGDMAFGVARQLLEPALRSADSADRTRVLAGPARIGANALGVETGDPPTDEFAARHGLYWLVRTSLSAGLCLSRWMICSG